MKRPSEAPVDAKAVARSNLNVTHRRFMAETDAERKDEAGEDLIRTIFGNDSIAEDPAFARAVWEYIFAEKQSEPT